jgi:cytochrome P450
MAKPMLPRKVAMLTFPLYEAANRLGDHWLEKRDENGKIDDIRSDQQKWALNGVGWFIFNTNIDVFNPNDQLSNEFTEVSIKFVDSIFDVLTILPAMKSIPSKSYRDYVSAVRNMHSICSRIMKSRFEELEDLVKKGEEYLDEQRICVTEHMLIDSRITKSKALSQACDLLSAGVDTTSSTVGFLLHQISRHPDIQRDLLDETNRVCGHKEIPDFNDQHRMSLVRNCVKETMRIHAIIETASRNVENNIVLNGYQVHKNTSLFYMPMVAVKSFSGADFDKFDPYRWHDNKNQAEQ